MEIPLGLYRSHVRDASGLLEDEEGVVLPSLHAALAEALRCIREVMADAPGLSGMEFEIADERGQVVLRVPIQEIGEPEPQEMRARAA